MNAASVERTLAPFRVWLTAQGLSPASVNVRLSNVRQALCTLDPDATSEAFLAYVRPLRDVALRCTSWRQWIAYCTETGVWQPEPIPDRVATAAPAALQRAPRASAPATPPPSLERLDGEIEPLDDSYCGPGREWQIHPGERSKVTLTFEWRGGQHVDEINLRSFSAREAFIKQVSERFQIELADLRRDLDLVAHEHARRPPQGARTAPVTPGAAPAATTPNGAPNSASEGETARATPPPGYVIEHSRDHMVLRYADRTWTYKGLARARQNIHRSLYVDVTLETSAGPFPQGSLDLNQRMGSLPRRLATLTGIPEATLTADLQDAQVQIRNPPVPKVDIRPDPPAPPHMPRLASLSNYTDIYQALQLPEYSPEAWVEQVAASYLLWRHWFPFYGDHDNLRGTVEDFYADCAALPAQAPHLYPQVYAKLQESEAAFLNGIGCPAGYAPFPPQPPESLWQRRESLAPLRTFHELFPHPDAPINPSDTLTTGSSAAQPRVLHQQDDRTWRLLLTQAAIPGKSEEAYQIEVTAPTGTHVFLLPSDATPQKQEELLLSTHFRLRIPFAPLRSDFTAVLSCFFEASTAGPPVQPFSLPSPTAPVPPPVPPSAPAPAHTPAKVVPTKPLPERAPSGVKRPEGAPPRPSSAVGPIPPPGVLAARRRAQLAAKVEEDARAAKAAQQTAKLSAEADALAALIPEFEEAQALARQISALQAEEAALPVYRIIEGGS